MRHTLILIPFLGLSLSAACQRDETSSTRGERSAPIGTTLDERAGAPTARSWNGAPAGETQSNQAINRDDDQRQSNRVEVDPILLERVRVSGRAATALEKKIGDSFGDGWAIEETQGGGFVATRIDLSRSTADTDDKVMDRITTLRRA